jgi:site-specific recombinase XerD
VVATIDRYLESRVVRAGCHSPTDPLFVRRLKSEYVAINRQAMDGLVGGWYCRVGVIPPGSLAQALRHTHATLLVDAGASLPEVQRLLGHADLSTIQVYLKVAGRGLEEAALSNPARVLIRPQERPRFCFSPVLWVHPGRWTAGSSVRQLLPRLASKAGIDKRVHAHGLRHTHAAELAEEGYPVNFIQDQLARQPGYHRPVSPSPPPPASKPGAAASGPVGVRSR